jgi:catechol 2,3-dioxygenase-like lactoylglutathione lyase family enzyme
MEIRIQCLCIDTPDPARIARFWESALGWRRTWEEEDQVCLEPPEGRPEDGIAPDLVFLKVPEGKTVKNRLHLDLRPADQSAEVARLGALGARQVSIGQGNVGWVVMADPDGNEFDVLQPLTPDELLAASDRQVHRARGVIVLQGQLAQGIRPRAVTGIRNVVGSYDLGRHAATPLGASWLVGQRLSDEDKIIPLRPGFLDSSVS